MQIDNSIDYRALTAAHFTTYAQPDHIKKLVDQNRETLANIATMAGSTIARQTQAEVRQNLLGSDIDIMV